MRNHKEDYELKDLKNTLTRNKNKKDKKNRKGYFDLLN